MGPEAREEKAAQAIDLLPAKDRKELLDYAGVSGRSLAGCVRSALRSFLAQARRNKKHREKQRQAEGAAA